MANADDDTRGRHLSSGLGIGIIVGAGVLMGVVEIRHFQKMSSTLGIAVFALLPVLFNIGLVGAGVVLWRSRFEGEEITRIAGWVLFGMVVIGLLATWTITHQNIRGRPFAHAPFVTVNNLSAGGMIGFVLGWYDAQRRRYRRQVETERTRLEFLHSSLRHNALNGVNIILGHADLLAERVDDAHSSHVETIRERSEELTRFTEATSALMENVFGHQDTSRRPIDVAVVLADEVDAARDQYAHAEFSLEAPDAVFIEGDDFVADLFSNLLSNAVVHNDKRIPEVTVSAHRSGDEVVVRVADNGPGMSDGAKDRMMNWNVKGAGSPGTGLGLAIAQTITDRYGGTLAIGDNDPDGTVVQVALPMASPPAPDVQADETQVV